LLMNTILEKERLSGGIGFCRMLIIPSNINIPWFGPDKTDADYMYVFLNIVMPIAMEFAPDLVVILENP
jgi:hypothetical protein